MMKNPSPSLAKGHDIEQRLGGYPWDGTPLGPVSAWPAGLKAVVRTVLDMTIPAAVLAGEDATIIGYSPTYAALSEKDRDILGKPFAALWLAAHPAVRDACEQARASGKGQALSLWPAAERGAAAAGTRYDVSFTPIRGEDATILGLLNTVAETAGSGEQDEAARTIEGERTAFPLARRGHPAARLAGARAWPVGLVQPAMASLYGAFRRGERERGLAARRPSSRS